MDRTIHANPQSMTIGFQSSVDGINNTPMVKKRNPITNAYQPILIRIERFIALDLLFLHLHDVRVHHYHQSTETDEMCLIQYAEILYRVLTRYNPIEKSCREYQCYT